MDEGALSVSVAEITTKTSPTQKRDIESFTDDHEDDDVQPSPPKASRVALNESSPPSVITIDDMQHFIACSPDMAFIIAGDGCFAHVYHVKDLNEIHRKCTNSDDDHPLVNHAIAKFMYHGWCTKFLFSPDSQQLAICLTDKIKLIDTKTWENTATISLDKDGWTIDVNSIEYSPCGSALVASVDYEPKSKLLITWDHRRNTKKVSEPYSRLLFYTHIRTPSPVLANDMKIPDSQFNLSWSASVRIDNGGNAEAAKPGSSTTLISSEEDSNQIHVYLISHDFSKLIRHYSFEVKTLHPNDENESDSDSDSDSDSECDSECGSHLDDDDCSGCTEWLSIVYCMFHPDGRVMLTTTNSFEVWNISGPQPVREVFARIEADCSFGCGTRLVCSPANPNHIYFWQTNGDSNNEIVCVNVNDGSIQRKYMSFDGEVEYFLCTNDKLFISVSSDEDPILQFDISS